MDIIKELIEVADSRDRAYGPSADLRIEKKAAAEIDRLRSELAECRKDAARYQWLRSINCPWPGVFQHEGNDDYGWSAIAGQDLDAAIDAAMAGGE